MLHRITLLAFLFALSFKTKGQVITNSTEKIKQRKVRSADIFVQRLTDSTDLCDIGYLRLRFVYDSIGRKKVLEDYYQGRYYGSYNYTYEGTTLRCIERIYVHANGKMDTLSIGVNMIPILQEEIYSNAKDWSVVTNDRGLIASITVPKKYLLTMKYTYYMD